MSDSEEKKELLFGKVLMGTGGPIFKLPKQSIQKPVIAFLKELKKTISQYINNEYISTNDFFEMKRKEYNEQKAILEQIVNVPAYKTYLKANGNQYNEMLEEYRDYNQQVKDAKKNRPFKKKSFNLILQKEGGSKKNNRKTKQNNRKTKQNNRKTKKNKK
jgi:maltooligosyltrehalose synthase